MEPQHFDPNQFEYGFDPFARYPLEFPVQLLPSDQFLHWTVPGQAISTVPATFTGNDFPLAEGGLLQALQQSDSAQIVAQLAFNGDSRAQQFPNPATSDQRPSPEPPNHSYADEDVVPRYEEAHRSNFTSYSASVWKANYPHIKQLYLDEYKSLEDTMKYMADNHDFRPS